MIPNSCSNKIRSSIFQSGNHSKDLFSPGRITIFPVIVCPKTGFINIYTLFVRYILDFLLICRYFLWILLFVATSLFFRVIPRRLNALLIA